MAGFEAYHTCLNVTGGQGAWAQVPVIFPPLPRAVGRGDYSLTPQPCSSEFGGAPTDPHIGPFPTSWPPLLSTQDSGQQPGICLFGSLGVTTRMCLMTVTDSICKAGSIPHLPKHSRVLNCWWAAWLGKFCCFSQTLGPSPRSHFHISRRRTALLVFDSWKPLSVICVDPKTSGHTSQATAYFWTAESNKVESASLRQWIFD